MTRAGLLIRLLTLLGVMAGVASDSERVLLLGDSQCDVMQQMGSSLAETLAAHTPAHLDVTYTMDCDGWRRVAQPRAVVSPTGTHDRVSAPDASPTPMLKA